MPLLSWCLRKAGVETISPQWADPFRMPVARDLAERLAHAVDLYPCDVLFVHRDAEREDPATRREEIRQASATLDRAPIPVIPVRMTEAWLLFDERAIRLAAGNPNGTAELRLPPLHRVEQEPNPKQILLDAIRRASELGARRRAKLTPRESIHRLAEVIDEFQPLEALLAFRELQADIAAFVERLDQDNDEIRS